MAATAIGAELGLIGAAESAALIGAGLLSVLLFPLIGLVLLRRLLVREGTRLDVRGADAEAPVPYSCT